MSENKTPWTPELKALAREREKARLAAAKQEHEDWVAAGCPVVGLEEMVRWVLAALDVRGAGGCPCPQARALLSWAKKNRDTFFRAYVVKLTQGGKGGKREEPEEFGQEALDFLKTLKKGVGDEPGEH